MSLLHPLPSVDVEVPSPDRVPLAVERKGAVARDVIEDLHPHGVHDGEHLGGRHVGKKVVMSVDNGEPRLLGRVRWPLQEGFRPVPQERRKRPGAASFLLVPSGSICSGIEENPRRRKNPRGAGRELQAASLRAPPHGNRGPLTGTGSPPCRLSREAVKGRPPCPCSPRRS